MFLCNVADWTYLGEEDARNFTDTAKQLLEIGIASVLRQVGHAHRTPFIGCCNIWERKRKVNQLFCSHSLFSLQHFFVSL